MMLSEAIERLRDRVTIGEFVERMDLDWDRVMDALKFEDLIDESIFVIFEDELNEELEDEDLFGIDDM
jgi:hypothetical protein